MTENIPEGTNLAKKRNITINAKILLPYLFVAISIFYIYIEIKSGLQKVDFNRYIVSPSDAAILVFGCLGTIMLSAIYHVQLMRFKFGSVSPPSLIAHAYSVGQLIRYIPGRILGIVFHIGILRTKQATKEVLSALVVQTVYDYVWATILCSVFFVYFFKEDVFIFLALIPASLVTFFAHKQQWVSKLMIVSFALIGQARRIEIASSVSRGKSVLMTAIVVTVWVPLMLGFVFSYGDIFGKKDALFISICYIMSAMLSLLVFFVPSGIGIREAGFIFLGGATGYESSSLVFVAISARIALIVADVLNAALFILLRRISVL